jgi:hypothetical protein
MDRELLDNKRIYEGNERIIKKDDRNLCQKQEEECETNETEEQVIVAGAEHLAAVLKTTVEHFFPHFNVWLSEVADNRNQDMIIYKRETILWVGLLLFILKCGARQQIRNEMRTEEFCNNVKHLSGQYDIEQVLHDDCLVYFLGKSKLEDLEQLQVKMMQRLIRNKLFDRYRLPGGYLTIAVDGVHVHTFDYEHCAQCLVREDKNGNKSWSHKKVQASLVLPNNICLPIAHEWIENNDGSKKQDCEINALYRLLKKIRVYYPRMKICLLLDALYCGEPVFSAIEKADMEWIVVFKEGVMPEVYEWIQQSLRLDGVEIVEERNEKKIPLRKKRNHDERFMRNKKPQYIEREQVTEGTYKFKNGIEHWNNKRAYNYLATREIKDDKVLCDYEWLVSEGIAKEMNKNTVKEFANQGGRIRWKTENEGFNIQKNGGYNLEHCYCKHPTIMKMFYVLLDIAHIINQLIEKGSLISIKALGSIKNIARRMLEHMRTTVFILIKNQKRIQIRIAWDTS